jgi:hypothetical protein
MVAGRSATVFRVGMPRDAAGPVAQMENPTVRSAAAAGTARDRARAASAARERDMRTSPGGAGEKVHPRYITAGRAASVDDGRARPR